MTTIHSSAPSQVPAAVQATRALLALIGITHLVIPPVMWVAHASLAAQVANEHPSFTADAVHRTVQITLWSAVGFHVALAVLCGFLAAKLGSAKSWARRLTIVSQALAVLFSLVSWSSSPMFHAVIPVVDAAGVLIIVLLCASTPAREFFRPAQRPEQRSEKSPVSR